MSACTVFSTTNVTVSECFMKTMPESLSKEKYFEEVCKDLKFIIKQDGEYTSCTLEGPWETVVKTEQLFRASLEEWILSGRKETFIPNICCKKSDSLKIPTLQQDDDNKTQVARENLLLTEPLKINDLRKCVYEKCSKSSFHIKCSKHALKTRTQCSPLEKNLRNKESQNKTEDLECTKEDSQSLPKADISDIERVPSAENEVYMDIQLEHNYNHLKSNENTDMRSDNGEPIVENEIYMDIKLSKTNHDSFTDPDLPVMLVVAKEDEPGIEVLQLNINKVNGKISPRKENIGEGTVPIHQSRDLKLRKKNYEEKAPFKYFCNQCSFKTKRNSHMRNHSRFHEKICTIYSCEQCDFSTIRASHLQRHLGTHKPEAFTCFECSYSTHSETLFNRHQRRKHTAKNSNEPKTMDTYQCLQCDYMTTSEKTFNRHLTVHARRGKTKPSCFKCKQCSYQTPSRSNFYRHLGGVHGDERPYMCTTCGLCFKRSDTLAQHQTTHAKSEELGRNEFKCSKCEKCYRSANALEEHRLTHEEERRYLCEICGASFKTRAVQRKHFIETHVHTKINPCSTCSKTFTTKYLLKRHMKVHSLPQQDKDSAKQANSISQEAVAGTIDWCESIMPAQQASNVQVFVVHQEPSEQKLTMQERHPFQVSPSLVATRTLPGPVEYVISEGIPENGDCSVGASHITNAGYGDIITLAFVQED